MAETLQRIWPRLGVEALARLLAHVDPRWQGAAGYVEGPCPIGVGGCAADPRAAYVYPRADGWPPMIRCHHESCGHQESVFDALAVKLGRRKATLLLRSQAPAGGSKRPAD